jgi:hypothetical protein
MNNHDNSEARDTLLLAGGVALVIFGAGMLLAGPVIRRTVLGALTPMLPGLALSQERRSRRAFASRRSGVSNPSVNQP